ncbi:unnamed protein product [Amoebophrya sp. A25]|nr:unnamed protein product [Amoebophrya sp. A25]|eukprot:GSA25T00002067001.1
MDASSSSMWALHEHLTTEARGGYPRLLLWGNAFAAMYAYRKMVLGTREPGQFGEGALGITLRHCLALTVATLFFSHCGSIVTALMFFSDVTPVPFANTEVIPANVVTLVIIVCYGAVEREQRLCESVPEGKSRTKNTCRYINKARGRSKSPRKMNKRVSGVVSKKTSQSPSGGKRASEDDTPSTTPQSFLTRVILALESFFFGYVAPWLAAVDSATTAMAFTESKFYQINGKPESRNGPVFPSSSFSSTFLTAMGIPESVSTLLPGGLLLSGAAGMVTLTVTGPIQVVGLKHWGSPLVDMQVTQFWALILTVIHIAELSYLYGTAQNTHPISFMILPYLWAFYATVPTSLLR